MTKTKKIPTPPGQANPSWLYAYLFFYTVGACCSFLTVALLVWIAYCIAIEAAPLAAISFLAGLPTLAVFALLLLIMVISCAAWQAGAHYHQKFEKGR